MTGATLPSISGPRQALAAIYFTTGALTESRLALLRRTAGAGHVSAATAEEETALDELVEKDLIRDGQLTEAGWRELREADHDRESD